MTALPAYLNKLTILKQIPIFEGLNWFEQNRVARKVAIVEFNKGDAVCQQGAPADAFYVLVSGRVRAFTINIAGQKEETDVILRGAHFGVISALTGENHSHTYEAINDSVVLRISKEDFSGLLKSIPKLAVTLSQNLSLRIRKHVTRSPDTQESTIIAVYAPLKGSGSSTYAANLALNLKKQCDKKVLLLSLSSDPNDVRINLADIVYDHHKIIQSITKGKSFIDVLSVKFDASNSAVLSKISQFVSAPVNDYNYIIFDLPNEMDDVVMKTLVQSDIVHLVSLDRGKDLEMTRAVIDRLAAALKDRFHADNVQVIISGIDREHISYEEIQKILNYDVFMVLPHLDASEFTFVAIDQGFSFVEVKENTEYNNVIRRLSRRISGVMVGLVLGGGAALGLAHIGVIRTLEKEGIPVDIVVGSSMGALIGAIWSVGHPADELEKYGREFENKLGALKLVDPPAERLFIAITIILFFLVIFNFYLTGLHIFLRTLLAITLGMISFFLMMTALLTISGLVRGHAIGSWLREKMGNKTFHDSKIPAKIVAYDLMRRKEIVIDHGSLVDAVRKSIAIPGVISPIMEGDQMIIDGGVLNPLPTNVLVEMGVRKIIAVNVLQSPQDVMYSAELEEERRQRQWAVPFNKNPFKYVGIRAAHLLGRTVTPNVADIVVRTLQASEYILAEASSKQADVLIHPDLRGVQWFELYAVNELIKRGEAAAQKALPAIKELVKK